MAEAPDARNVDRETSDSRLSLADFLSLPGNIVRTITEAARTTPGRLFGIASGLTVLALLIGLVGAVVVQAKKDTITSLIEQREPVAVAAQQVYRALSDADATAASAFLSTGTEPAALRDRYEANIAQAGAALTRSAVDSAGLPDAAQKIDILNRQIPVYTGLIETARANNRQGFPAGASYLREASELMRAKILPAAHDLYRIDTGRLSEAQHSASRFPWLVTLLVLGFLVALIVAQRYLTRRTNRIFNIGLVVATIATAIIVLWGTTSMTVQSVLVDSGKDDGSAQVDILVQARIASLQARADETLTLVARGDGDRYEEDFTQLATHLMGVDGKSGLIQQAKNLSATDEAHSLLSSALDHARQWLGAHGKVRELDNGGDYNSAVNLAIDSQDPLSAASAFARLDEDLASAITLGRQEFLADTRNADRSLFLLSPGFALLGLVAVFGVVIGFRERLREYR